MNKKIIVRIFVILLIIIWMRLVFGFSAQEAEESSSLSIRVISIFVKDTDMQHALEPYVRKVAHYSEYGIGGMLFLSFFATFKLSDMKKITFSSIVGLIYATTDEVHQLFVDGRSGKIQDVYIDTLGVITGALAMQLILMIISNIIERKERNNQIVDKND